MNRLIVIGLLMVFAGWGCCSARSILQPSLAAQSTSPIASSAQPNSTSPAQSTLPRRIAAGGAAVQSPIAVDNMATASDSTATAGNSTSSAANTTAGTGQQSAVSPSAENVTAQTVQPLPVVKHPQQPVPVAGQRPRPQTPTGLQGYPPGSFELGTLLNGTKFIPGACGLTPSSLGYQCSWAGPHGIILHWSYNVSHPPINRCTTNNAAPNVEARSNMTWLGDIGVHFALQVATKEKLHLGFVGPARRYYPSDGVHTGTYCSGAGCDPKSPQVEISYYASPSISVVTGNRALRDPSVMEGWAAWASSSFDDLTGVLCFSRRANSRQMKVAPTIGNGVTFSYAVNGKTPYTYKAPRLGMVEIDFKTGSAVLVELPYGAIRAHLVLLLLAFAVFIPAGLLTNRHSWLFVDDKKETGLSPFWTLVHISLLSVGALMGLAGMIMGLETFGADGKNPLDSAQQALGLTAVGLSLLLVVLYALRPLVAAAPGQGNPLAAPLKVAGLMTVCAGCAASFIGCVVARDNWAVPLKTWVPFCTIVCGLVTMVAIALELRYQKLVRTGAYNPKTHTVSNLNPLPLARIRTHREPFSSKKEGLLAPSHTYSDRLNEFGMGSASGGNHGGFSPSGKGLDAKGNLVHILAAAEGRLSSSGGSTPGSVTYRGRASMASGSGVVSGFPSNPGDRINESV